jgi:hypothetical protein
LQVVGQRLAALAYPVATPLEPCEDLDDALASFDEAGIVVPPALVAVWREVGAVSFVDLGRYRHVAFWDDVLDRWRAGDDGRDVGYPPCCDGLVIDGPSQDGWVDYVIDTLEEGVDQGLPPGIELAPDALHKDNVSGSGPYELLMPGADDDPWLAPVDGFGWTDPPPPSAPPGAPDLVSYLRTSVLDCGGFPGLFGHPAFAPVLRDLTADLPVF